MPPSPYAPQDGQLYVSVPLTNFSIAYLQRPSAFIGRRLVPSIPVSKQGDRYVTYPKGAFFRSMMKRRAKGTRATVASYEIDNTPSYFCDTWGLAKPIADEDRVNEAPPVNLDRDTSEWLAQQAALTREKEWVGKFFKAGVWSYNKTGVAAAPGANEFLQWNSASSTPIKNVRDWRREMLSETGFEPNQLTLGRATYDALADHPEIIDRVKYGQTPGRPAEVNARTMAQVFEVDEVLVANAVENTAAEGAADTIGFIAGKGAMLTYRPERPSLLTPMAMATFAWTGFLPGQGPTLGEVISRWRDGPARTDYIQIELAFDMRVIAPDLGLYAATAVA